MDERSRAGGTVAVSDFGGVGGEGGMGGVF